MTEEGQGDREDHPHAVVDEVRPITNRELRFYAVCRAIAVGVSRVYFPGRVYHADRLPRDGPYILAPVHRSNLDWLVVARVTRTRLRYLAKDGIWKLRPVGHLLDLLGAFPVHRGAADREAFRRALMVLRAGEPLVVFPEGTRRSGPRIEEIKEGAAYLALRSGVSIVPVGTAGTEEAMPKGRAFPRPGRVVVTVGEPIAVTLSKVDGKSHVPRSMTRSLNDELVVGLQKSFDEARSIYERRVKAAGLASLPSGSNRVENVEDRDSSR